MVHVSVVTIIFVIATGAILHLSLAEDDYINLKLIDDVCVPAANYSYPVVETICKYDKRVHCLSDDQCKIGSKCCQYQGSCKQCVDLKEGTISKPKVDPELAKTQRRKRQSFGCVSCSCVKSCRSDSDCARYRTRRRCYHNSCSSYCVK